MGGFTTWDCSGTPGGVIRWNDDGIPDKRASGEWDVPLGIVSPAYNLKKIWGCNDCARCVTVCQGKDCQGIGEPVGHPPCSASSTTLMYAAAGSTDWDGMDMHQHGREVTATALDCQARCATIQNCAYFVWWPKNGSCHIQDSKAQLRPFPRCEGCKTVYGPSSCPSTTSTLPAGTTTSTVTTSTTSTVADLGIRSGDTVFLKTHSGVGEHVDIEGSAVQARWEARGNWQAIVIEKGHGDGSIHSGDAVFLKTHTGAHIDIVGIDVQARWNDKGGWQALVIEKPFGSSVVLPNDLICLRSLNTGRHLDVHNHIVRARWDDCGNWQTLRIEKEAEGALFSGDLIHLAAHTGNRIEVEGSNVKARWSDRGWWQTFRVESKHGGRAVFSGDTVFLTAHTGNAVDVQGTDVRARWNDHGALQELVFERKDGLGVIMPGDAVSLQAHTGNMIDVEGHSVQARWFDRGLWQSLIIEKASPRRLMAAGLVNVTDSDIGAALLPAMVLVLATGLAAILGRHRLDKAQPLGACKIQPISESHDAELGN